MQTESTYAKEQNLALKKKLNNEKVNCNKQMIKIQQQHH